MERRTEDQRNLLLLVKASNNTVSYWAGFAWDKAGRFTTFEAWKTHVDEFDRRVQSPLKISSDSQDRSGQREGLTRHRHRRGQRCGVFKYQVRDCQGRSVDKGTLRLDRTPRQLDVPISGIVELVK